MISLSVPQRLYPLRPVPEQLRLIRSKARFAVVPAGRRSGKTERAKRKLVKSAMLGNPETRFFAGAPTRDQAKRIFWSDLKAMIRPDLLAKSPSESELYLKLIHGPEIWVVGMDKPERIEGTPWDGGVLDEIANMKPTAWPQNVRPALSDRRGWCWLIGVPEGRNHYYDLAQYARSGKDPEWDYFSWPTSEVLPPEEIEAARRELDPLVFQQEYEASFVSFEGRCYYSFLQETHCRPLKYNPRAPLVLCFDFNVDPGVAVIAQEQLMPGSELVGTGVIGEIFIPRNSNTEAVCRKIAQDWGRHEGRVLCYGDATGGARKTSATSGSDWDIIRRDLRVVFQQGAEYRVKSANPAERARINAVNTRCKAGDGSIRLMVDAAKAPHVVRDLEGVTLLKGGSGEIDKKATPELTHLCFAAGTMVELDSGPCAIEFAPLRGRVRTWDGSFAEYENVGVTRRQVDVVTVCISDGAAVKCTPDHLWLTPQGWMCARDLEGRQLLDWRSSLTRLPAKPSTARRITEAQAGILTDRTAESARARPDSIALFGNTITVRYRKALAFITRTVIAATIKSKTSGSSSPRARTSSITGRPSTRSTGSGSSPSCPLRVRLLGHGTAVLRGVLGTVSTLWGRGTRAWSASASGAVVRTYPSIAPAFSAAISARPLIGTTQASMTRRAGVFGVGSSSQSIGIARRSSAVAHARQPLSVISVAASGLGDVYCLHVPDAGCFALVNGAIVSNSDSLGYYIEYEFPVSGAGMQRVKLSGV